MNLKRSGGGAFCGPPPPRDAVEFGQQADQQIERLLIRRFEKLVSVRRFFLLWVGLFVAMFFITVMQLRALSPYYQKLQPVPGGLYREGLVGNFTNANPLYATSSADAAVSRLVFSGLFKYDTKNNLAGDLASGYELDDTQKLYTVHLRNGIKWHDGRDFTADDVVFTYDTIQKADAASPLFSSWRDIKVTKKDSTTVVFELPNPLSSFPYALTNGIVPEHLLRETPSVQLRSASFNTNPVGTGPFRWKFVEVTGIDPNERQQTITLAKYSRYHLGEPKLDGFSLATFPDEKKLIQAFVQKQITAMSGLETVPEEIAKDGAIQIYNTPLTSAVMAFFKNSKPILNDVNVRQALVKSVDRQLIKNLSRYPLKLVDEPILKGQLGYDPALAQSPYDLAAANKLLDDAGWVRGADDIRTKAGQPLALNLISQDTSSYTRLADSLQEQWTKLGAKITVRYFNGEDLQSQVITAHDYDILLYGISIGADPDPFAFWDSSQASLTSQGRLNLSEYKSTAADQALEGARTRSDPDIRTAKYKQFLSAWAKDAPALALYQPNFLYITRGPVLNYQRRADNSSVDRFYNVANWMIRQKHVTN